MAPNSDRIRPDLGKALLELQPVQHALRDPYYSVTRRPIDSSWHHAGFTGVMSGFNPTLHTHFCAVESALDRWLVDPAAPVNDRESQVRLVKEVLFLAHDYLHSWAYRALAAMEPEMAPYGPVTRDNLELQSFLLVLTEAVAVVGLDYWYLCVADVDERCGVDLGVGPRTVHYRERLLPEYRRYNPKLTVQAPQFFHQILRLYCLGRFDGFSEQDLLDSEAVGSWMVREMLISPRQREVSRDWLGRMGGMEFSQEELTELFPAPSEGLRRQVTAVAELLWRKIKHGEEFFFPIPPDTPSWRYPEGAAVDFRYANLQRMEGAAPPEGPLASKENVSFYVDQYLSRFRLPATQDPNALEALRLEIDAIKADLDPRRLERLASTLAPVARGAPDPAPLELLFAN